MQQPLDGRHCLNRSGLYRRAPRFSTIRSHVVGVALAPLALAVMALRSIRRVIPQLLAVIFGPAPALTRRTATHHLIRMISGRHEYFFAIWAAAMQHLICIAQRETREYQQRGRASVVLSMILWQRDSCG